MIQLKTFALGYLRSSVRAKPVHDVETLDALEFANIIGDKRGSDRESVRFEGHAAGIPNVSR
jgi:hypothetical protein